MVDFLTFTEKIPNGKFCVVFVKRFNTSIFDNEFLTPWFFEDNDLISAKSATRIPSEIQTMKIYYGFKYFKIIISSLLEQSNCWMLLNAVFSF